MAARDVLFIGGIIFALALALFISFFAFNTIFDNLISNPVVNQTNSTVTAFQNTQRMMGQFDYIILAVFIGLALVLIITGWFIGGEPIYMMVYFIVVIIAVVAAGIMSYIWGIVSQASVFGTTLAYFPIGNHLISNLHYYVAVLGIIGIIVMFAKPAFQGSAI